MDAIRPLHQAEKEKLSADQVHFPVDACSSLSAPRCVASGLWHKVLVGCDHRFFGSAPARLCGLLRSFCEHLAHPYIARALSRLPRAPTCDLPSRSCCPVRPFASLFSVRRRLRLFRRPLSYLDLPASSKAIAMAWRRLLTLPALPLRPRLSSPCLNSCITRPVIRLWRGDVDAIR
jgi:hypothetical protein